ncbi:MAG: FAD-dependent thymidylate synthase [Candidatus Yanofskybacteria bacterium]|nr:FAD-dependent thymidylate synthase [Candidatus Yanofskybacteria bacterium]
MENNLPPRLIDESNTTFRSVSEGSEKWLYRPIQCLDHGFVYLVDYCGDDYSIVQAARVSYGQGTKKVSTDEGLIRYLMRHAHTTPFEMVEFKFHCKMPIFVARQWIRHRMASVNEYSGRYSEMLNEFYLPDRSVLKKQATGNRQGRGDDLSVDDQNFVLGLLKSEYGSQHATYKRFLEIDLAKELARIGLSVANYTQWYWKIDLHNLFHFLRLRLDSHAQHEIQVFGQAIAQIISESVPMAWKAFEDYRLYSVNFSRLELDVLGQNQWPMSEEKASQVILSIVNKREREEFWDKLKNLNFIT